ncbi:MAG: BTAD domain-containing putative transcriptional regulator [Burkholderiales bacterium]
MTRRRAQPAKLTRPRLHAPVARERLFRRLDDLRARPVVWVTGPPGAGKTTLVAGYLDAADLNGLWYLADAADSDPATFFLYLREAVAAFGRQSARPLPLFTPEYLPDIAGFARRFFREAFRRLPPQTPIVIDNYHELATDSPLHAALAAASGEIPSEANVVVVSRAEPPPAYAELLLRECISVLPWAELKLTAPECEAVAAARGVRDAGLAARLHAQTDGWFAGLALLLERANTGATSRAAVRADALEIVFDFFAQAIFDAAPAEVQRVFLTAAQIPRVTGSLVARLSGIAAAEEHLAAFHRRHLFVERTDGGERAYRLHALFRAFLRQRGPSALDPETLRAIAPTAARVMEDDGALEDAFVLWADAGHASEAVRVFGAAAPTLLAQGRWRTLLDWVAVLGDLGHGADLRVRYWAGRARLHQDRIAARRDLEAVYAAFVAADDPVGQLLSATAVLEALHLHYRDFRAMDAWIERLAALLAGGPPPLSPDDELRVQTALLIASTYRMPEHPALNSARARVEALIDGPVNVNLKVTAASVLHGLENTTLDVTAAELAARVARPLLRSAEVTVQTAGFYLAMEGYTAYMHGRYDTALATLAEADAVIEGHGLKELGINVSHWRALCQRRAGMTDAAEDTLRRMEDEIASLDAAFAPRDFIRACLAFDRGRYREAVDAASSGLEVTSGGGQFIGTMLVGLVTANLFIGSGEYARAETVLDDLRRHVTGPVTDHFLAAIELNTAWLAHRSGDLPRRDRHLADALHCSTDPRARERLRWYPNALSELLPEAIAQRIDVEAARDLARLPQIAPVRLDLEHWPWKIRVLTLGHFEVQVDDRPLRFGRKVPKRTLAVLKALIALGGEGVPEERLIDALWPGEDADTAAHSLMAALHRLRGLLGHGEAVIQRGGRLSIDRRLCWIDALSLPPESDALDACREFLCRYRGPFLDGDTGEPWALPLRERLRGRFVRAVQIVAADCERKGELDAALALHERGIAADPLVEAFYQGAIRSLIAAGRSAEAGSVYRRLQRTLGVALGTHPSPETRRLIESLIRIE